MAISSVTELESSLISFAGSDSTLTRQGVGKKRKEDQNGEEGGGIIQGKRLF